MSFLSPFFRNPITDFTGPLISAQTGIRCADFEMRLLNCYEAYGYPRGIEVCQLYYEDFQECCTRDKQMQRVATMYNERQRQAKINKDTAFEKPPAMHTF